MEGTKAVAASLLGASAAVAAIMRWRMARRADLSGQVALVTGASRGLGLLIARELAARGAGVGGGGGAGGGGGGGGGGAGGAGGVGGVGAGGGAGGGGGGGGGAGGGGGRGAGRGPPRGGAPGAGTAKVQLPGGT